MPPPATDDNGQAAQIGISQQLDGCVEGVHVEMRYESASRRRHGPDCAARLWLCTASAGAIS
jgi:hypothetical protein